MTFRTPGVYILEPPSFPPSVVPVETAIPVFIGFTEKIPDPQDPLKPVKIFDLEEFESIFGQVDHSKDVTYEVTVTRDVDGQLIPPSAEDIKIIPVKEDKFYNYNLYHALQLYFRNGGGPCYIISLGNHAETNGQPNTDKPFNPHVDSSDDSSFGWEDAIAAADIEDEPTIFVIPELVYTITGNDAAGSSDYENTINAALNQSLIRKDRFVIIDVPKRANTGTAKTRISTDISNFRDAFSDSFSLAARKFGAAYYPYLEVAVDIASLSMKDVEITNNGETINERKIVLEGKLMEATTTRNDDGSLDVGEAEEKAGFDQLYKLEINNDYNGIYNEIVSRLRNYPFIIPPSSAIAGIYAQVDDQRGVFKAPANVTVAGINRATIKIDDASQENMNVDTSGKSVNPVRTVTDRGMVVWGARTLDANNLDFRYINVRRFFNFVEESVKKAMYRFVFEPNDANTWASARAAIENFLTVQWEAGALQGAKADDAFFVQVGLGQTMNPNDILEGKLKIRIGMAVVRPAEFIILEFTQILPTS